MMSCCAFKLRLPVVFVVVLSGLFISSCGNSTRGEGDFVPVVNSGSRVFVADGPVILRARVLRWSDESLELKYQLQNNTTSTLKVFNEAPKSAIFVGYAPRAADILLKDEKPVLYSGTVFRDDCLNPARPTTVTANTLPPNFLLTARLSQPLPLKSFCIEVPENSANPDTLEFCVGYLEETDKNLAVALAEGEQQTGRAGEYITSIVGQMRVCVTLLR